jgi:hypothetical protein
MKRLISLILISIIICDITEINEDHVIPNLLMTKDQAKTLLLNSLRSSAAKYKYPYPSSYSNYVQNLASSTIVKFDKIEHNKVDDLKRTHGFPQKIVNQFKAINYSKHEITFDEFKFDRIVGTLKLENVFGVAARLDEQYVYFVYVKGQATGKIVVKYYSYPYKSCNPYIFIKICKTKHKKVKRGTTNSEFEIIRKSLVAKFYDTLNSILDLDQQKMIDKFKRLASSKRTSFPAYYKKYVVSVKTNLDFKTITLYSTNAIQNLKNSGFNEKTINSIKNIFGKQYYSVDLYQITKHETDELRLKMGVAYSVGGRVLLSYVDAISQSKIYEHYCNMERYSSKETCLEDSVCVEECNAYEKLVKDPKNLEKDIPGFNKKQYNNNLKQILLADVTNEVYDILKEIKY